MADNKDTGPGDTDQEEAGLGLDDDDRLPWLEAADDYDEEGEVSPTRLLVMVLGGLLLIGTVLGGLWWVQNGGARGQGELIAAQKGDYKVVPEDDAARDFEGEGDASFAASEGAEPVGRVDPARMPEEPAVSPAAREAAAKKAAAVKAGTSGAAAKKTTGTPAKTAAASAKPAASAPSGSAMIQLGAFSSEASAVKAWSGLSKRFAYLAELDKSVASATVDGGKVYRLRVAAGTAANAATLCGKLRVAGENCVVVR